MAGCDKTVKQSFYAEKVKDVILHNTDELHQKLYLKLEMVLPVPLIKRRI
jgi:hypothetical protein